MLFLLATLAASATTPPVVRRPAPAATKSCRPSVTYAKNEAKNRGVHRLDQEPAAIAYYAVDREIGGCPVPALVQTGSGR